MIIFQTCAVDVFSLGCIYYYVLTRGKHPFGEVLKRQANIMQGEYSLKLLGTSSLFFLIILVFLHTSVTVVQRSMALLSCLNFVGSSPLRGLEQK